VAVVTGIGFTAVEIPPIRRPGLAVVTVVAVEPTVSSLDGP
jgi:hypothetical protein